MAYPEGIAQMPGASVWAVLFFFMLFTIGLGSQVSSLVILPLDDGRIHTLEYKLTNCMVLREKR